MSSKISTPQHLFEAEKKALEIFQEIENRGLIKAGITELDLNTSILELAQELLNTRTFWHKRIVRAGKNTLLPYKHNPPNLVIQDDDILFFDLGPVLEKWEADIGKTFVLGNDKTKLKLRDDTLRCWKEGQAFILKNSGATGAKVYQFTKNLAAKYGWEFGGEHCGHLIGIFPHEKLQGEIKRNYLHPENHEPINLKNHQGETRYWIYEIHLVDKEGEIGGFYEGFVGAFNDSL